MKQLRVLLFPLGWDASPSQGYPQQYVATTTPSQNPVHACNALVLPEKKLVSIHSYFDICHKNANLLKIPWVPHN